MILKEILKVTMDIKLGINWIWMRLIEGIALMLHSNNLFNYDSNTIKDTIQLQLLLQLNYTSSSD